eukprot:12170336-Alexandrium_andersonii.AAC.1
MSSVKPTWRCPASLSPWRPKLSDSHSSKRTRPMLSPAAVVGRKGHAPITHIQLDAGYSHCLLYTSDAADDM